MASQNCNEKSKAIDDCLNSMCTWIQDSSQFKSNESDQMLLSMLENWHPNTLFSELPTSSGSEGASPSNRAYNNALVELSEESNPDDAQILIAQYVSTNTKRGDINELQRVAMHLEMAPRDSNEPLEEGVDEITRNQAKVMKKNFRFMKDGKPVHLGQIHVINMGRERQGKSPMKFSLNYLSTNVPNVESIESRGVEKDKSLQPYFDKDSFRRTLERYRNKKTQYTDSEHLKKKLAENIESTKTNNHDHDTIEIVEHVHDDQHKDKVIDEAKNRSYEAFETPIVHHDRTDGQEHEKSYGNFERSYVGGEKPPIGRVHQITQEFESPYHNDGSNGRFHLISTESFKNNNGNNNDMHTYGTPGYARAFRYHSKRRSAHIYEWPCPNGSFRMLKRD